MKRIVAGYASRERNGTSACTSQVPQVTCQRILGRPMEQLTHSTWRPSFDL